MYRVIVVIALVHVGGGSLAKENVRHLQKTTYDEQDDTYCSRPSDLKGKIRIAYGINARQELHPWNVGVYQKRNNSYDMICGGSLITPNLVLTAAHCFLTAYVDGPTYENDDEYKIAVGKHTRDISIMDYSYTSVIDVDTIYFEDDYVGELLNYANDIAILKLSTNITVSDYVSPVCIDWNKLYKVSVGDVGKVVGWGKTENKEHSDILLEGSLRYIDRYSCRNMYSSDFKKYLTKDKFCANSHSRQSVLDGDSGAGLTFLFNNTRYLTGIVSLKEKDSTDTTALFTDIRENIEWIHKVYIAAKDSSAIHESIKMERSPAVQMCHQYSELIYNFIEDPINSSKQIKVNDCLGAQTQIVGGSLAQPKEFPHMVMLSYYEWSDWRCGGSLISNRWVLTSATCSLVTNEHHARIARLGGLNYFSKNSDSRIKKYDIVERILHPKYKPPSMYDDIALLRLKTDVEFSPYIRPVCLNTDQSLLNPTTEIIATGWGVPSIGLKQNRDLLKVSLKIVPIEKCQKGYTGINGLENGINERSMICVGRLEGGKDTCQGDYGGPLQIVNTNYTCMYTQIGIIPFGLARCGSVNSPGVYTKISSYVPWIEKIVWPQTK